EHTTPGIGLSMKVERAVVMPSGFSSCGVPASRGHARWQCRDRAGGSLHPSLAKWILSRMRIVFQTILLVTLVLIIPSLSEGASRSDRAQRRAAHPTVQTPSARSTTSAVKSRPSRGTIKPVGAKVNNAAQQAKKKDISDYEAMEDLHAKMAHNLTLMNKI